MICYSNMHANRLRGEKHAQIDIQRHMEAVEGPGMSHDDARSKD